MDDSKKILKEYLTHAHALVLKESMRQKAEIIKLVKELLNRGVGYERIKKITDFYKYSLNSSNLELENESIFNEMKTKLEALK